jgi:hypothetical protein
MTTRLIILNDPDKQVTTFAPGLGQTGTGGAQKCWKPMIILI